MTRSGADVQQAARHGAEPHGINIFNACRLTVGRWILRCRDTGEGKAPWKSVVHAILLCKRTLRRAGGGTPDLPFLSAPRFEHLASLMRLWSRAGRLWPEGQKEATVVVVLMV